MGGWVGGMGGWVGWMTGWLHPRARPTKHICFDRPLADPIASTAGTQVGCPRTSVTACAGDRKRAVYRGARVDSDAEGSWHASGTAVRVVPGW